jgi:hypothetical protein
MKINFERILVGIVTLIFCFALIFADAEGYINIGKFGYTGIGAWVTLVLQFYFRKSPSAESETKTNGGTK